MTRLFADSFYFFAILNANDEAHQRAPGSHSRRAGTFTPNPRA